MGNPVGCILQGGVGGPHLFRAFCDQPVQFGVQALERLFRLHPFRHLQIDSFGAAQVYDVKLTPEIAKAPQSCIDLRITLPRWRKPIPRLQI